MTNIFRYFTITLFLLTVCGTAMAQHAEINNISIKATTAMDTIRDTTTLANMRSERDALIKDGWDIIGVEKHKEFVVIIGVRPIKSKGKEETNEDIVFFVSRDVNSHGDTIVTKTMFRNGVPIKAYFNNKEFDL